MKNTITIDGNKVDFYNVSTFGHVASTLLELGIPADQLAAKYPTYRVVDVTSAGTLHAALVERFGEDGYRITGAGYTIDRDGNDFTLYHSAGHYVTVEERMDEEGDMEIVYWSQDDNGFEELTLRQAYDKFIL